MTSPELCLPVQEGEPLEQEFAHVCDALAVGAPVLEAVVGEALEHVEALRRRDVPVALLLDLAEDPRLDQRTAATTSAQHVNTTCVHLHDCSYVL